MIGYHRASCNALIVDRRGSGPSPTSPDAACGYACLNGLRSLSEEGRCYFILAGFWGLYRATSFDYQSPIRNFAEVIQVGALEPEACRDLAVQPMRADLARAGESLRAALTGWRALDGKGPHSPDARLDRVIVYGLIERAGLTLAEVLDLLAAQGVAVAPERIRKSLILLQLAFLTGREPGRAPALLPLASAPVAEPGAGRGAGADSGPGGGVVGGLRARVGSRRRRRPRIRARPG